MKDPIELYRDPKKRVPTAGIVSVTIPEVSVFVMSDVVVADVSVS